MNAVICQSTVQQIHCKLIFLMTLFVILSSAAPHKTHDVLSHFSVNYIFECFALIMKACFSCCCGCCSLITITSGATKSLQSKRTGWLLSEVQSVWLNVEFNIKQKKNNFTPLISNHSLLDLMCFLYASDGLEWSEYWAVILVHYFHSFAHRVKIAFIVFPAAQHFDKLH